MRFRKQLLLVSLVGSLTLLRSLTLGLHRLSPRPGRPVVQDRFLGNFYNPFSKGEPAHRFLSQPAPHHYPRAVPVSAYKGNMKYLPQQDRKPVNTDNDNFGDDDDGGLFSFFPSMPSINLERASGLIEPFKKSMEGCRGKIISELAADLLSSGTGRSLMGLFTDKTSLDNAIQNPFDTLNKLYELLKRTFQNSYDVCLGGVTDFLRTVTHQKPVADEQTTNKDESDPAPAVAPQAAAPTSSDAAAPQPTTTNAEKSVTSDTKPDQAEKIEGGSAEVKTEPVTQGDLPKKEEATAEATPKKEEVTTEAKPDAGPQPEIKKNEGDSSSQADAEPVKPSNRGLHLRRHRRHRAK